MSTDKTVYRVSSMAEVSAVPDNGLRVVSLFSGCGGSSLGYRMAGCKVLWANEFIPAVAETYCANFPATILDTRDIREISGKDILASIRMDRGELDVLDGSPPCAAFSQAGAKSEAWNKERKYSSTKQRVDDLFDNYLRILADVMPRVFVAENVAGLAQGQSQGRFIAIRAKMEQVGYKVSTRIVDAQWMGCATRRKRLIFMGVRKDLQRSPVFPSPLPYRYTIKEVLPNILAIKGSGHAENWQDTNRPAPTITASDGKLQSKTSFFSSCYVRDKENERRKWTIEELKLVSGFPADFVLTGDFGEQWERIGRAVPPPMMAAIGKAIASHVLCERVQ